MDDKVARNIEEALRNLPQRLARALADFGKAPETASAPKQEAAGKAGEDVARKRLATLRIKDEVPRPQGEVPSLTSRLERVGFAAGHFFEPLREVAQFSRSMRGLVDSLGGLLGKGNQEEVPVVGPPRPVSRKHLAELEHRAEHVGALAKTGKSPGIKVVPREPEKTYRLTPEGEEKIPPPLKRRGLAPEVYRVAGLDQRRVKPEVYELSGEPKRAKPDLKPIPLAESGASSASPGKDSSAKPAHYDVAEPKVGPVVTPPGSKLTQVLSAPRLAPNVLARHRRDTPEIPVPAKLRTDWKDRPHSPTAPPHGGLPFLFSPLFSDESGTSKRPPSATLSNPPVALPPGQSQTGPGAKPSEDKQLADEMRALREAMKELKESVNQMKTDETENLETAPKKKGIWREGPPPGPSGGSTGSGATAGGGLRGAARPSLTDMALRALLTRLLA